MGPKTRLGKPSADTATRIEHRAQQEMSFFTPTDRVPIG